MRTIDTIVVHCSDSHWGDADAIDKWHKARGWKGIGYHYVILNGYRTAGGAYRPAIDGFVEKGREDGEVGAHVHGHNDTSIGICLIGGKDAKGAEVRDFLSAEQRRGLYTLLAGLEHDYANCRIMGHCEFPNVAKTCPNLDMDALRKDYERWKTARA